MHTRDENKTESDITIKNRAKERKRGGEGEKEGGDTRCAWGLGVLPTTLGLSWPVPLFFFFLATNKHDFKATTTETTEILCTQDKNKHKKKALNLENNTQNQNPLTELL